MYKNMTQKQRTKNAFGKHNSEKTINGKNNDRKKNHEKTIGGIKIERKIINEKILDRQTIN